MPEKRGSIVQDDDVEERARYFLAQSARELPDELTAILGGELVVHEDRDVEIAVFAGLVPGSASKKKRDPDAFDFGQSLREPLGRG